MEAMRINKFLSKCGYCSRREADRLLELGKIRVNGHIPVLGQMISGLVTNLSGMHNLPSHC